MTSHIFLADSILEKKQKAQNRPIVAGTTSSLTETIAFAINPTTGEFGDPIHLGSTKGTIVTLCDNLVDTIATDSGSSINVDKGGYIRNWYVFDI